jgi:streptomycin 6-kinase
VRFNIPEHFVRTQIDLQGEAGLDWLAGLPALVETCAAHWNLTIDGMMEPLTYNFLVSARRSSGLPVVLKLCPPDGEFASQRAALHHFAGNGAVRLLGWNEPRDVLMLERCVPGHSLHTLTDDEAIEVAGSTMRRLWKPLMTAAAFPTLDDWAKGFHRLRHHYVGTGPFRGALVERAERRFAAFDLSSDDVVLLHGDLHHGNILAAKREPWLAIDPKGVLGVPEYEPATFIINQTTAAVNARDLRRLLARRVDGLAASAGLDPLDVREWAVAHAVLSAWWTVEDHGRVGEFALTCAEALASD